ncbi:MAG: CysS/YqeB C-terminal domain-containing protein, partial [Candidatus Heimdallarchaeota archaeon]
INDGTLQEAFDIYKLLLDTYGLFAGLTGGTSSGGEETLNHLMQFVVELRDEARKNKDYATSDKIRDKLNELNIVLEDSPKGTIWKIKS